MLTFILQSSPFSEHNTSSQGAVQSNRFNLSPVSMAMNCKCESKMVFSCYQKQRIYGEGYKAPTIAKLLREEGLQCSRVKFIKKFQDTDNINRRVASGQPCIW